MTSSSAAPSDQKVYGCVAYPQALDQYEEMMQKFLFAPDDVGEWSFTAKGDFHGLGYSGIDTATAEGSASEDRTLTLYGMSGQVRGEHKLTKGCKEMCVIGRVEKTYPKSF